MKARRFPARLLPVLVALPLVLWTGCGSVSTFSNTNSINRGQLSASTTSLQFGTIPSGSSKFLWDTVTNTGYSAMTISQILTSGAGFGFSGINPPLTLSPGQAVSFRVAFTPPSSGAVNGSLSILSASQRFLRPRSRNTRGESNSYPILAIALSGTAVRPGQLRITPASINFGNVVVGTTRTQNASLLATNGPVTVAAARLAGSEFTISGISLPSTIPSGSSLHFLLTFSPQSSGSTVGSLTFMDSSSSGVSEALNGTGTPQGQHTVTLHWNASTSNGVIGYYVYRATIAGGPYSKISMLDPSTTAVDNTVLSGQTYYYVVTAVDSSAQESPYSNQATAVIPFP